MIVFAYGTRHRLVRNLQITCERIGYADRIQATKSLADTKLPSGGKQHGPKNRNGASFVALICKKGCASKATSKSSYGRKADSKVIITILRCS